MNKSLMIETSQLTKRFGKFKAVDGINVKIEEGTVHGFIGPNGAGKTTTIKMLVGAIRCTAGAGSIKGYPLGSVPARQLVGYSPERPSFYSDMAAIDYLVYMARLSGVKGDVRGKAAELLDWIELGDFVEAKVKGFSAGMKQRLSLAQALIHEPEVLILDEPTANLDPTGRMSILDKLRETSRRRGITIFISSHILSELEQLVDSATLINKGQIVAEDSMTNLKKAYSRNRYLLKTSNNEAVLKTLKRKVTLADIWFDAEGFAHLATEDDERLKQEVVKAIAETGALLEHFSREEITLETIYRKAIMEKE